MSIFNFPKAPEGAVSPQPQAILQAVRQVAAVVNRSLTGKLNALGEVTLTSSAGSTTLSDPRLTVNSFIAWDPVTSAAAAELAAGTLYVEEANRRNGEFTLTHASNGLTRTYKYLVIG